MKKRKLKLFTAAFMTAALTLASVGGLETKVQAATRYECENMSLSGTYVGKVSSPFSGVALYANNDSCQTGNISWDGTEKTISIRGASNNNNTATVVVKMNGYTMGSVTFQGTTPTVKTLTCKPSAGNYPIQLVVTNDVGTWDVYVDYLEISGSSSGSSSGTQGGNQGGSTSGANGNVYLCFDDAPNNSTTSNLINNLKSAGCTQATFFVYGNGISYNSSAWNALCNSGFSIQNHSQSHSNMSNWSYQQVYNDLNQCNSAIVNAGKAKPTKVRIPYLTNNSTISQACSALGLSIVNPTVDTQDWNGASTNSIINACNNLSAGGNTLMHDGNYNTVSAVSSIVNNLKNKGFGFAQY